MTRPYVNSSSSSSNHNNTSTRDNSYLSNSDSTLNSSANTISSQYYNSMRNRSATTTRNAINSGLNFSNHSAASNSSSTTGPETNPNPDTISTVPGAYSITRSTPGGSSQVYRVTVPSGVVPGNEFTVHAGNRRVRVRCPPSSRPGHSLQITLPPEALTNRSRLAPAPLTRPCSTLKKGDPSSPIDDRGEDPFMRHDSSIGTGGAVSMSKEVLEVNRNAVNGGGTPQTFLVTIPEGIRPGMQFNVNAGGQKFKVTCPPNAGPNSKVRIVAPAAGRGGNKASGGGAPEEPEAAPKMQVFEVVVPPGVRPNQPFTLIANDQRVLVTCPPNASSGQRIRFQLPVPTDKSKRAKVRMSYKDNSGSSGWERTIRATDMKFQWVRVEDAADNKKHGAGMGGRALEDMGDFDFGKTAYVRNIQYFEGNDARMRTGIVSLIKAQNAVVESKLVDHNYQGTNQTKTLLQYTDIVDMQSKSLDQKVEWFHKSVCEELYQPWEKGHVKIIVQRESLLEDSVNAVMSLGREDMRKRWRIEFAGEPGIEAGGLTREWFQLVTEQIFDPDFGLWLPSNNNQMSMQINPASHISCPDDYLRFFRFLGRIMGRALFDQQLIKGHTVRHIYKHLLGWPITFDDLEAQDEEYCTQLKKMISMEDLSMMCLDFTAAEETLGVRTEIPLIPGGADVDVTSENLSEYLEATLMYRMLNRCKPQMTELMLGFFDVVPEAALTIFDPNELELILCGLPKIDMTDWMNNTKYSGYFESGGSRDRVVEWFWQVVNEDFDQEKRARLLQFVTGTSGVPPRGFAVLQGNDGNIKKFCIHGVSREQYVYPRAHTCFNRIDLPNYSSRSELRERLSQAVSMTFVGFDME